MNLESYAEFPPLGTSLLSPESIKKEDENMLLAPLNSTLNPQAEVFTPKSALNISGCLLPATSEPNPLVKGKFNSDRITRSKANRKFASETKSRFFEWQEGTRVAGKRRYSMMSLANTTISSIDTNMSEGMENENDPDVLKRREKNIKYGKDTDTYQRYIKLVPREQRVVGSPSTPSKEKVYSRRQWDGLIKHWRINLHNWEREVNGETKQPVVSTPKRAKTKCDRRSFGRNITNGCSPVRSKGDMLPPVNKFFASFNESMKENLAEPGLMLPPTTTVTPCTEDVKENKVQDVTPIKWVDWSKECVSSDEDSNDGNAINVQAQPKVPEEEVSMDKAYKCGSLVEAIAVFDENTYNEDEDEDYLPPGEKRSNREGIRFEPAEKDDESQSVDQHTLFNRITRSKYPYKPQ